MRWWHTDNWSHPSHYLVDPYTWPWSPNGHGHEWTTATPLVQFQLALPFWDTAISKFDHENPCSRSCVWSKVKVTFDFKGQGYGQGQTCWSHLKPGIQLIRLLFVSWQWDHCWLRYRKFCIWPWKFKDKVMANDKPYGNICALEFNQYVWNGTIFGWDIANSIFDLEKSRSRSQRKSTKI